MINENNGGIIGFFKERVIGIFEDYVFIITSLALLSPSLSIPGKKSTSHYNQLCLFVVIIAFVISTQGVFSYYQIFSSIIFIIPASIFTKCVQAENRKRAKLLLLFLPIPMLWFYNESIRTHSINITKSNHAIAEQIVSREKDKTVLYWGALDAGFGKATLLPSIPVWSHLNGSTEEMQQAQKEAALSATPDYIFTSEKIENMYSLDLIEVGYTKAISLPKFDANSVTLSLWVKQSLN